jgi:hypothetical protein
MVEQAAFFDIPLTHLSWAAGMALIASGIATLFWMVSFSFIKRALLTINSPSL